MVDGSLRHVLHRKDRANNMQGKNWLFTRLVILTCQKLSKTPLETGGVSGTLLWMALELLNGSSNKK